MSRSILTIGSSIKTRPVSAINAVSMTNGVVVRFRVDTDRSAAGLGESQKYDFCLTTEDAIRLRDKLNRSITSATIRQEAD